MYVHNIYAIYTGLYITCSVGRSVIIEPKELM